MICEQGRPSPYFSIVIPVYNRQHLLRRAVGSCLRQSFERFEIIIVDDASSDDSAAVAEELAATDSRLRVLRHTTNRGVCPARNTGASSSTGQWIICLDSDDELAAGALQAMHASTVGLPVEVAGARFMCVFDDGAESPEPRLPVGLMDYAGLLAWWGDGAARRRESLICVRRETHAEVRYPESRAYEQAYHLNFFRRYTMYSTDIVALAAHQDAETSLCRTPTVAELVRNAADHADEYEAALAAHGEGMRIHAPGIHADFIRAAAVQSFLAGRRRAGMRWVAEGLRLGGSVMIWATAAMLGLIGPRVLAASKVVLHRLQTLKALRQRRQASSP